MPNATASRVRTYLDELERALSALPKDRRNEIVRDIRGHIDVALAERGEPSAADVEQLLDELGTPQEIAEAAYAELPPGRTKMAGRDVGTIILLLVGGLLLPFVGWFIGVVMLWTSTAWRTKDKVIGTLLVPGGLFAPMVLLLVSVFAVSSTSECASGGSVGGKTVMHCTHSGTGNLAAAVYLTVLVLSVVGPIFSTAWLIRTARRVA